MHVLSIALLAVLTSCTPLPPVPGDFSCTTFTESYWGEFSFDVDTASDVVSTVSDLWGIERDQVEINLTTNGEVSAVKWFSDAVLGEGGHYYVPFYEVQQLKRYMPGGATCSPRSHKSSTVWVIQVTILLSATLGLKGTSVV